MVANMKTEREPHLSVANTVDVTKTSDLPCKTGMSEKLNYFDMCSSYKCLSKTYTTCRSKASLTDSNLCCTQLENKPVQ